MVGVVAVAILKNIYLHICSERFSFSLFNVCKFRLQSAAMLFGFAYFLLLRVAKFYSKYLHSAYSWIKQK